MMMNDHLIINNRPSLGKVRTANFYQPYRTDKATYTSPLHTHTSVHPYIHSAAPLTDVPGQIALYLNNTAMSNTSIRQILGENLTPRTFFDYGCYEFEKRFTREKKIRRIANVVHSGYNLKRFLQGYIRYYRRPGYAHMRGSLEQTLNMFIHYIKSGEEWKHFRKLPYGDDALPLISLFILELRRDMFLHPEKYHFLQKSKASMAKHRWYKAFELEQLLDACLMEDSSYHAACVQQLGLDITHTDSLHWNMKDKKHDVGYPYSYKHLESLLQDSFLPGLKGKISLNDIRLEMGCSANQFYYLKLWSYNYNKDEERKRQLLRYLTMDLMTRLYGRKFQRMPVGSYTILENWVG
jgi:hypothetical protein